MSDLERRIRYIESRLARVAEGKGLDSLPGAELAIAQVELAAQSAISGLPSGGAVVIDTGNCDGVLIPERNLTLSITYRIRMPEAPIVCSALRTSEILLEYFPGGLSARYWDSGLLGPIPDWLNTVFNRIGPPTNHRFRMSCESLGTSTPTLFHWIYCNNVIDADLITAEYTSGSEVVDPFYLAFALPAAPCPSQTICGTEQITAASVT